MSKTLRWLGAAATLFFFVSVYTPLWNWAGKQLAVESSLEKADAIVVLGSGVMPDGTLENESLRRANYGMVLFKQGLSSTIVFSGPTPPESNRSEAEVRRSIATTLGIPSDHIETIDHATTTAEEAAQIATVLKKRSAKKILLVTESLHMRRAMRVFERAGLQVLAAPSDNFPAAAVTPRNRLLLMQRVSEQAGGLLYYFIGGRI